MKKISKAWTPLITSFNGNDNNNIKQSAIMLNGIKNIKQQSTSTRKFNTAPSTSKQQNKGSRQRCKCHALCMNALDHLFWWQWQQQHQTINYHAQWHQKHQTTINLNQKNSTLHLLQANDDIRAQDRATNVMHFAWMPQWSCSMVSKISNQPQPKDNTTCSASKQLHQGSRQSCKCHALHMNTLDCLFPC